MNHSVSILLVAGALFAVSASAADAVSPRDQGVYVAPMLRYAMPDKDRDIDDGLGGVLAAGYRFNPGWAVELAGNFEKLDHDGGGSSSIKGGRLSALGYPFASLPGFFVSIGGGYLDVSHQGPTRRSKSDPMFEWGIGYLVPLSIGSYDFGIRLQGGMRHQQRPGGTGNDSDPKGLRDGLFDVGLQLPFGLRQPPPPPVETPVVVVPPAAVCADTQDNDGDGLVDFPADPGCSAADDNDETDPPQCSDGKDNDGDGLVDFPADKGCSAADDNDETDPCKSPEPGERITLKGCGTGDTIVLRGVNFDFNKSTLTANAKTILDNVSEELSAYPEIKVELSGHTDAKGSDEYNQKLSERRAASVLKYLATKGIAADRMTSIGYGESKPVADNETDEGRELNRRVELRITEGVAGAAPPTAGAEAAPAAAPAPAP